MSQLFVARSSRICHLVASLKRMCEQYAAEKPWDRSDLRVDYLKFKRDIFPAVLAARRRAATCTVDALVV
jgi:hypothetical protein